MSIRQIVGELLPYAAAAAVALFSYLAILATANTQRKTIDKWEATKRAKESRQ